MSYWLRFYIPNDPNEIFETDSDQVLATGYVLTHAGGFRSFVAQIFPINDAPTIKRRPLPEGYALNDGEGPDSIVTRNVGGVPLYYVHAGDVAKLEFGPYYVSHFDHAMMAFIRALPADYPLIPYVVSI